MPQDNDSKRASGPSDHDIDSCDILARVQKQRESLKALSDANALLNGEHAFTTHVLSLLAMLVQHKEEAQEEMQRHALAIAVLEQVASATTSAKETSHTLVHRTYHELCVRLVEARVTHYSQLEVFLEGMLGGKNPAAN